MSGDEEAGDFNFNDLNNVEMDSTSSFEDMAADFDLSDAERNLLSRSFVHSEISGSSKIMKIGFEVNFNNAEEITEEGLPLMIMFHKKGILLDLFADLHKHFPTRGHKEP